MAIETELPTTDRAASLAAARDLCAFIDRSPTPWHAVAEVAARLSAAGFTELDEREPFRVEPGDRRFVRRGGTIVALVAGTVSPAVGGFRVLGAHTDSPNLRVKPNADVVKSGWQQLGVEIYGGVLLSTWLDRDLSLAGRAFVRDGVGVATRLVDLERPIARVPNLAIHLNRGVNKDGLVLNEQRHMAPVLGLGKEPVLKGLLSRALDVAEDALLGFDLCLYDVTKAAIGGVADELLFASRLDNLASCHAALCALLARVDPGPETRVVVLYDHEEVGSRSAAGAAGSVMRDVLGRLVDGHADRQAQALPRAIARSLLVSADMAHALHPNYTDQHEPQHAPQLNRGLVIKSNANQSYATDGETAARMEGLCQDAGFMAQRFVVRTDLPCGSTIGPITAAQLGIATVDVGAPMLSMHSCRELAGTLDVARTIDVFARALG